MQDIYIGEEGKGIPLVLVHGFLGSSEMWRSQIDFFKDYFIVITNLFHAKELFYLLFFSFLNQIKDQAYP